MKLGNSRIWIFSKISRVFLFLFLLSSCQRSGCQYFSHSAKNSTCTVIKSLDHLNQVRNEASLPPLECDRSSQPQTNYSLIRTYPSSGPEEKKPEGYSFVSLEKNSKKKSFLGRGYYSDVYLLKKNYEETIFALKVSQEGTYSEIEGKLAEILCAGTGNLATAELISTTRILSSYIPGQTLHQHIINDNFFNNVDNMQEKLKELVLKMSEERIFYTDLRPKNVIFHDELKEWVIVDTENPLFFRSKEEVLKNFFQTYSRIGKGGRGNWFKHTNKYSSEQRSRLDVFFYDILKL